MKLDFGVTFFLVNSKESTPSPHSFPTTTLSYLKSAKEKKNRLPPKIECAPSLIQFSSPIERNYSKFSSKPPQIQVQVSCLEGRHHSEFKPKTNS